MSSGTTLRTIFYPSHETKALRRFSTSHAIHLEECFSGDGHQGRSY